MTRPLGRDDPLRRIGKNSKGLGDEQRKPVLGGFLVYVGDFVDVNDPANDPPDTNIHSPPWQNGFTYMEDYPVWFAHGVDGETDMGGMYDLVTGSPVSGDVAFEMPLEWATSAPLAASFPVELDTDVWTIAIQSIDHTTGEVRIFWPIVADPYVT